MFELSTLSPDLGYTSAMLISRSRLQAHQFLYMADREEEYSDKVVPSNRSSSDSFLQHFSSDATIGFFHTSWSPVQ